MTLQNKYFGQSEQTASILGHGTWTMGGHWGPRDDRGAIDALVRALEAGITFIDTALVYGDGHSESLIASALREAKKKAFVATKIPPLDRHWPARPDSLVADTFPADHIIKSTETSLNNLRTDCIDLQQLHVWSNSWFGNGDWLEAIGQLKNAGKIRHFGISINDHDPRSALTLVESGLIDSVQVIYNIFDQSPEEELFPLCQKKNVAVIVRVPFDEGSLTGCLDFTKPFHKKDWRRFYFTEERIVETQKRIFDLKDVAQKHQMTLAQMALRFCLSHPAVTTVIPGMRTIQNVDANVAAAKLGALPQNIINELNSHAWPRNFYPSW